MKGVTLSLCGHGMHPLTADQNMASAAARNPDRAMSEPFNMLMLANDRALSRGPHAALGHDETGAGPSAPTLC